MDCIPGHSRTFTVRDDGKLIPRSLAGERADITSGIALTITFDSIFFFYKPSNNIVIAKVKTFRKHHIFESASFSCDKEHKNGYKKAQNEISI